MPWQLDVQSPTGQRDVDSAACTHISCTLRTAGHLPRSGWNRRTDRWMDRQIKRQTRQTDEHINGQMYEDMDRWTHIQIKRQTDRQTDRQTNRWTYKQTDGRRYGQMNTQTKRQTDKQTNRWTERQTDRQANRWIDRQTDWWTNRQKERQKPTHTSFYYPESCMCCFLSFIHTRFGTADKYTNGRMDGRSGWNRWTNRWMYRQIKRQTERQYHLTVSMRLSVLCVNMAVCRCLGNAPSANAKSCILADISASPSSMIAFITRPAPFTTAIDGCCTHTHEILNGCSTVIMCSLHEKQNGLTTTFLAVQTWIAPVKTN